MLKLDPAVALYKSQAGRRTNTGTNPSAGDGPRCYKISRLQKAADWPAPKLCDKLRIPLRASSVTQLREQHLSHLQVGRIEALGEPVVDARHSRPKICSTRDVQDLLLSTSVPHRSVGSDPGATEWCACATIRKAQLISLAEALRRFVSDSDRRVSWDSPHTGIFSPLQQMNFTAGANRRWFK